MFGSKNINDKKISRSKSPSNKKENRMPDPNSSIFRSRDDVKSKQSGKLYKLKVDWKAEKISRLESRMNMNETPCKMRYLGSIPFLDDVCYFHLDHSKEIQRYR